MTCQHPNPDFILTPELTHYGKETCRDCGKFVRWVPHPETLLRHAENARKLEFLRTLKMGEWESGFILSLEKSGRFSPKQQLKFDEISERHGYQPISPA